MRKRYLAISLVCFAISLLIAVSCFAGSFAFRDEFTTARSAGAVNGTAAEPGVGTRTVTDSTNLMSISGGNLVIAGRVSGATGDPALWEPVITRAAGRTLLHTPITINTAKRYDFGFDSDQTGGISSNALIVSSTSGSYRIMESETVGTAIPPALVNGSAYSTAISLRSTGAFYFVKPVDGNWGLSWISATVNTASLYPSIQGFNMATSCSGIRIPSTLWLPSPLVSDSFATAFGTSDGAGHAEVTGLGSGGSGKVWSNGGTTWSVSGAKAINTPVAGTSLVDANASTFEAAGGIYGWVKYGNNTVENDSNTLKITYVDNALGATEYLRDAKDLTSDLTVGTWYQVQIDAKVNAGSTASVWWHDSVTGPVNFGTTTSASFASFTGTFRALHVNECRIGTTGLGAGEIIWLDNWTLKPLVLSQLISTVETSTRDVIATVAISTTPAGTQAGLAIGIDSATDPKYGVIAYHDGTNCKLDKLVNGVWTNVISAAKTWSNNAEIRVIRDGTTFRLYYNNAQIGATSTISDVGNGTKHGLFNTHTTPLDNFTVYACGTSGEYDLDLNVLMAPGAGSTFNINLGYN